MPIKWRSHKSVFQPSKIIHTHTHTQKAKRIVYINILLYSAEWKYFSENKKTRLYRIIIRHIRKNARPVTYIAEPRSSFFSSPVGNVVGKAMIKENAPKDSVMLQYSQHITVCVYVVHVI